MMWVIEKQKTKKLHDQFVISQVLMTNSCFVTEATLAAAITKKTREIMQILLRLYLAENMEQSGGA